MEAKNCHERILSRVFHVSLTTGIVLILVLKDTELRRACFDGNWLYVAAFMSLCFIGFIFYFVASCMDPGFAEISDEKSIMVSFEKAEHESESQSDGEEGNEESCKILATPSFGGARLRRCGYCAILQPLRAKHCEDCGRCVRRYDHHCPWLGNCVGERNHRFFWCFLLTQCVLIAWATEITWYAFMYKKEWLAWFLGNGFLIFAMFVLGLTFIVVFLLFCCHSYLMVTAQTTWEYMSRSRISYLKTLSEDVNPFDQGVFCNVYSFLCRCRVQKWEVLLRQRDRWA